MLIILKHATLEFGAYITIVWSLAPIKITLLYWYNQ